MAPRDPGLLLSVAAAAATADPAAGTADSPPASSATTAAAADARLAPPPGVKGRSAPPGRARAAGGDGAGPLREAEAGSPAGAAAEGGEGAGRRRDQGRSPPLRPLAASPLSPAPPPRSRLQPTGSDFICITRCGPRPRPAPRLAVRMVANAATTWREGKGAKTEGEGRWACGEAGAGWRARPGRKDGEGLSIQTQTITKPSKAARGQLRWLLVSQRFGV